MSNRASMLGALLLPAWLLVGCVGLGPLAGDDTREFEARCLESGGKRERVVCADVAALEQTLVYNRFGSFNPFGMMFALNRDVVPADGLDEPGGDPERIDCNARLGTETRRTDTRLNAGRVRLRDCERPRPLTLRANVGDVFVVRVSNLLMPAAPDFSKDVCAEGNGHDDRYRVAVREATETGSRQHVEHGEADCREPPSSDQDVTDAAPNWPRTRDVNFVMQGLTPIAMPGETDPDPACFGTDAAAPGDAFYCRYRITQQGTYFFASLAAPAGGEGSGGSLVHGLFGALVVERPGSRWYRSQTTAAAFDRAWPAEGVVPTRTRAGSPDYESVDDAGVPLLNMARTLPRSRSTRVAAIRQRGIAKARAVELVHGDLNAIIYCDRAARGAVCEPAESAQTGPGITVEPAFTAFREFSVFFHDELKTFYTRHFRELGEFGQLAGVKDGFAINYGASGMGSLLLANRKGIGPADDCLECLYEEFFLTSWANGDPALLEWYPDDPSNVHHSYLNDPVVFRNFHAGPKETHVFHLHAHQWFAGNDPNRGAYLDSQTIAPQQGFSYNVYHGGLRGPDGSGSGWWASQGSGNRNRTVGDSIFHCHLYPHFAQGMWALWRVHDVLEDGTRQLPDGQPHDGLSTRLSPHDQRAASRPGSVDRATGRWLDDVERAGTPVPAVVPLPGEPLPIAPSYATDADIDPETGRLRADAETPLPGYPFYIAGQPGHRPPQPPLDIARNLGGPKTAADAIDDRTPDDRSGTFAFGDDSGWGDWLDGGLNRHVVGAGATRELGIRLPDALTDPVHFDALDPQEQTNALRQVIAKAFALGDLSGKLKRASIDLLDPFGERLERAAMGFHHNGRLFRADGSDGALRLQTIAGDAVGGFEDGGYETGLAAAPSGMRSRTGSRDRTPRFYVNGGAPRPGAPFADPCGMWPAERDTGGDGPDPFTASWLDAPLTRDPRVAGFRRYEASAVQVDMIVNRAGWHDPQARINVLSADADRYKEGSGFISPLISDSEEPFFFRALSGECIEFRHTNELPKELELDDFQVKTPTDTIGQHIHLVKFDVTSSDGAANGWNYEDGTFAPDEIATRLCAWTKTGDAEASAHVARLGRAARAALPEEFTADFCASPPVVEARLWRLPRSAVPFLFQTTTQRWFADPILSFDENARARDRTMRTVFTHDHFAPSSIQQHGFYGALVIEPPAAFPDGGLPAPLVCNPDDVLASGECAGPLAQDEAGRTVAWGSEPLTGAKKLIHTLADDPTHPSYREFVLSIADFALLYDPRDRDDPAPLLSAMNDPRDPAVGLLDALHGMAKLLCEARYRQEPANLETVCGTGVDRDAEGSFHAAGDPPAWLAGGAFRDDAHRDEYQGDLIGGTGEIGELQDHLLAYRQKAAGTFRAADENGDGDPDRTAAMASPVAPPTRPESISVDHHDPYLVNYRGAPIPLRIADKDDDERLSNDCAPLAMNRAGEHGASEVVEALTNGSFFDSDGSVEDDEDCSRRYQIAGDRGDLGGALHSRLHRDPETPVLEAYAGERLAIRLIQGAQEVQHTFTVAGQPFKRNTDQAFPKGARPLVTDRPSSLQSQCLKRSALIATRPSRYRDWRDSRPEVRDSWSEEEREYWRAYEAALAECDNVEGFRFAHEIGISEHVEMQGSLRTDVGASVEFATTSRPSDERDEGGPPRESSDYLYHFGSVDALWNGAWGLVRVFRDEQAIDPATDPTRNVGPLAPSGPPVAIGTRLAGSTAGRVETGLQPPLAEAPGGSGLACPIPTAGETQRVVDVAIVAFETRRVFDAERGTVYGETVYDPDGLMLALLSPEDLGIDRIDDDDAWDALDDRGMVLEALETRYESQPEPFVLRVRAGDCLRLRVVNLLGDDGVMRDLIGDAILPKIVPINADPIPELVDDAAGGARLELSRLPDAAAPGGVRPSTRLALSFGLPGLDLIRDVPLGFGYNAEAFGSGDGGVATSPMLAAYAGRYRLDLPSDRVDLVGTLIDGAGTHLDAQIRTEDPLASRLPTGVPAPEIDYAVVPHSVTTSPGLEQVLGQTFAIEITVDMGTPVRIAGDAAPLEAVIRSICGGTTCFDVDTTHAALERSLRSALRRAVNDYTHWIPYAFGAVPVRATGDVIAQGVHGLFGAIVVSPTTWASPTSMSALACASDKAERIVETGGYVYCTLPPVDTMPGREPGDGQAARYVARSSSGATETQALREFVLFYQDGLHHRDDASTLPVVWADDGAPVVDDERNGETSIRLVPDCEVCDDSYDRGEVGVSHRSPAFSRLLRATSGEADIHEGSDLNAFVFPPDYVTQAAGQPRLQACEGEQIVIRIVHPGGRARQRAFVMNGYDYDELFPGFGFPRSALLAPGRSVSAWLEPLARALPSGEPRTVVWHDGSTHLRSGGTWGLLDVAPADSEACRG